mmetsp:Transcript_61101/g.189253  ORF Transcript_61101/g.189253 Transcript_61101/m.189253 type:complete len:474 (-) Transcript_61101:719-2140(-)
MQASKLASKQARNAGSHPAAAASFLASEVCRGGLVRAAHALLPGVLGVLSEEVIRDLALPRAEDPLLEERCGLHGPRGRLPEEAGRPETAPSAEAGPRAGVPGRAGLGEEGRGLGVVQHAVLGARGRREEELAVLRVVGAAVGVEGVARALRGARLRLLLVDEAQAVGPPRVVGLQGEGLAAALVAARARTGGEALGRGVAGGLARGAGLGGAVAAAHDVLPLDEVAAGAAAHLLVLDAACLVRRRLLHDACRVDVHEALADPVVPARLHGGRGSLLVHLLGVCVVVVVARRDVVAPQRHALRVVQDEAGVPLPALAHGGVPVLDQVLRLVATRNDPVVVDDVALDRRAVGAVHHEAVDAVPVALVVGEIHLALEVGVRVPGDVHPHAVDDVVLRRLAIAALPGAAVDEAVLARGVVPAGEAADGRVVPGVVLVVVRDLVHVVVHDVACQAHLDDVLVIDVLRRRQHHSALRR